jgi:hypothetical protein
METLCFNCTVAHRYSSPPLGVSSALDILMHATLSCMHATLSHEVQTATFQGSAFTPVGKLRPCTAGEAVLRGAGTSGCCDMSVFAPLNLASVLRCWCASTYCSDTIYTVPPPQHIHWHHATYPADPVFSGCCFKSIPPSWTSAARWLARLRSASLQFHGCL